MQARGLVVAAILLGCSCVLGAFADDALRDQEKLRAEPSSSVEKPTKFPQRSGGAMSNELFADALALSERELRDTLDRLREEERRYLAREGFGMDPLEMLRLGTQAVQLMQQIQALNASRQPSSAVPGSLPRSGADASTCEMFLRYANECRQRQRDIRTPGTTGLGTTGQAGAFNDCYNLYMKAYNENCR